MAGLRDCLYQVINLQMENRGDAEIAEAQERLNGLYDAFTAEYGLINDKANQQAFEADSAYYLLCSLEVLDGDGKLKQKADIFTQRTIRPHTAVTRADTAAEALAVSISEKAAVDLPYMQQLTGKTEKEITGELRGIIFRLPNRQGPDGKPVYAAADEYLSGNVRRKLREAEQAAQIDPSFSVNAEALRKVQPKDLDASEIAANLGATWIPPKIYPAIPHGDAAPAAIQEYTSLF